MAARAWHHVFAVWRVLQLLVVIAILVFVSLYAQQDKWDDRVTIACTMALCIISFLYLSTTLALHYSSHLSYSLCAILELVHVLLYAGDIVLTIFWNRSTRRDGDYPPFEYPTAFAPLSKLRLARFLMLAGGGLGVIHIIWCLVLQSGTPGKQRVFSDEEVEEVKPVMETPALEEVLREEGFGDSVTRAWKRGTSIRSGFFGGEGRKSKGSLGGMI